MIPVYQPYLPLDVFKYAKDALDSTWVSSHGKYITMVAEKLQDLLGVKHVLLVNNGTSAVHLLSKALQFKHPKVEKIIVPNNVYVAAINGFLFDRKYRLKAADADINTWNYNMKELYYTRYNSFSWGSSLEECILIVHNLGNIINVPNLKEKYPNTVFIEDNCEGLFGKYNNKYSGTESLCSAVSFFGNKNITCGEGGAVITNDTDVYNHLNHLQGQGQSSIRFIHNDLGYNYRITNVQAAILYGQLGLLDIILEKKNQLFSKYKDEFKDRDNIKFQSIEEGTCSANWMFGVRIVDSKYDYDHAEKFFKDNDVEIRPMFYPLSAHEYLKKEPLISLGYEDTAKKLNKECFILPSYPGLTSDEINYIISVTNQYLKLFGS